MVLFVTESNTEKGARMMAPTMSSLMEPNVTQPITPVEEELFCKLILYIEISNSRVRVWDVIILVPNLLFLLFLIVRFNRARLKLRATSSPIFFAFYGLVLVNVVISVIRCVVSMSVNAAAVVGGYVDTFLWITVRFFLLSTEMSVVIFGLAFGHLDSRSSIRYVLLATSLFSLAFSTSQGALEVLAPDESFRIHSKDFNIFGHGGMLFWFTSSIVFSMIYIIILILPWTRLRERLNLPTKKSFYLYVLFLALLNISQSVGSGLLLYGVREGLCVVDVTTCIYFTFFTPLVYHTFLSEFFGVSQPSIMFSYKAQVDDTMEDDDTVSLPHQQSFSSLKTDSDYIYQSNSVYDSTQFDSAIPAPLYNTSLQSPDSITGYSLDSQTIDLPSGEVKAKKPSLTLNLETNGLKVTSEPPPTAGQAGCLTGSLSGHPSKQQPHSTLLSAIKVV
ncbi:transmembrane protein adipocyte-associated 1-like isoform X2 [Homalodisca vitripennis]|uniref:transmembrane protein adipocyte-associated 1-like isoform X2 n=1 Tax=Homalodisca vitripennis TaxID=197043 RepID=UPI001EEA09AB|nr:transmembrane protein adipocyte-associated 1-like isoform X2 [Homalodisca vitripennis]